MKQIAVVWLMQDLPDSPDQLAAILQRFGFDGISVKVAQESYAYNQPAGLKPLKAYFDRLKDLGYEVEAWGYHTPDSANRQGEFIEEMRQKLGFSVYHLDVEAEWHEPYGMPRAAKAMLNPLKIGGFTVLVNSYRFPSYHPNLPWDAWRLHEKVDGWTPQMYWALADNPVEQLHQCLVEYGALNEKPVYPMGPLFGDNFTVGGERVYWEPKLGELEAFRIGCENAGIQKIYWYRLGWALKRSRFDMIAAATGIDRGNVLPPPTPEPGTALVIDNCTWLNMRSAADSSVDNRLAVVRAGTVVEDLGQDQGNWKKVRLTVEGYMHSAYLSSQE